MPDLEIEMSPQARAAAEEHCFSRVDVEVGGFLLGRIDEDRVVVEAVKPALAASSDQTHLTFTHEAWAEILDVLDTDFPGMSIVGWYHSHPGFGCFLSDYDVFIQENFFSAPGQHALVIDPIAGTWGQFVAADGAARSVGSGDTDLDAVGGTVDKVDIVAASSSGERRRVWPAVIAGVVAASLVVGGLAWFLGNVQGQDAAAADASGRIAAAEGTTAEVQQQLADVQQQLTDAQAQLAASAQASPAASPTASPTPTPEPAPDPVPGPLLLAVGEEGVFAVTHVVERGDNLWDLAARYLGDGTEFRRVLRANPDVRTQGLEPGQKITILMRGTLRGRE